MSDARNSDEYEVTSNARRYYEWLKQQEGEPVERLDTEVRHLLDVGTFRERHRGAYDRWAEAETKLWGADTANQFTDIGFACREAVQLFITDLVQQHQPPYVESNAEKTINRLQASSRRPAVRSERAPSPRPWSRTSRL